MKLLLLSDLHLGHDPSFRHNQEWDESEFDVVILAGDISEGNTGIEWAKNRFAKEVYYVPGNHEHYSSSFIQNLRDNLSFNWSSDNLTVCDNHTIVLGDTVLICSTLWTDFLFQQENIEDGLKNFKQLNDYYYAFTDNREVADPALSILNRHFYSKKFIDSELAKHQDKKCIVITHHAPHPISLHSKYKYDSINNLFINSNMGDIISRYQPALWVHGHVHNSFDYRLGNTRVIANPKGYKHENAWQFNPNLIVEI